MPIVASWLARMATFLTLFVLTFNSIGPVCLPFVRNVLKKGEDSPFERVTLMPRSQPFPCYQTSNFSSLSSLPFIIFFKSASVGQMKSISPILFGSWGNILSLGIMTVGESPTTTGYSFFDLELASVLGVICKLLISWGLMFYRFKMACSFLYCSSRTA